ncbi:MAG: M48 family metallopeptidase [Roseburia sp.]|nr:M48 family metallopeptidase [Roseburia sp.]
MDIAYNFWDILTITHPQEKESIQKIQESSFYVDLAKVIGSIRLRLNSKAEMNLEGYPVTKRTYPRLYHIYQKVLKRLHCDQEYELFVDFGYNLTAKTYGSAKDGHMIVINSACLEELNDEELAALLGYEIGHILSDHIQTRELLSSMDLVTKQISFGGDIVQKTIWGFFAKWLVGAEYTADRAALLASQSMEAVVSLLLKQMGSSLDKMTISQILNQRTEAVPEKLGMFFILMVQDMPSFGMIARIQELAQWIKSEEFRQRFPYMHYTARNFIKDIPQNDEDEQMLQMHKKAENGNAAIQKELGEYYLFDRGILPCEPETGMALIIEAALNGDGKAMFILSTAMNREIAGLKSDKVREEQLIRAAASRVDSLRKHAEALGELPKLKMLSDNLNEFAQKRRGKIHCYINTKHPGQALEGDAAQIARDAFWMCADDAVYAAELEKTEDGWFGTAVSKNGIYGRMQEDKYPFMISWKIYALGEVYQKYAKEDEYLFCDTHRLCRKQSEMVGSIMEILISIKLEIQKTIG